MYTCCNTNLQDSEEDLDLVQRCLEESSNLSTTGKSSLFYISGYAARKEGIQCSDDFQSNLPESEFTRQLSWGGLSFPPHDLCDDLYVSLSHEELNDAVKYFSKHFVKLTNLLDTTFRVKQAFTEDLLTAFLKLLLKVNTTKSMQSRINVPPCSEVTLCFYCVVFILFICIYSKIFVLPLDYF